MSNSTSVVIAAYPCSLSLRLISASIISISLYLECDLPPTKNSCTLPSTSMALHPGTFFTPLAFIMPRVLLTPFQSCDFA
uniref:Uncharacterized protein n=1 Tax=Arundo donax TaxID=35708 RepID=A0A0A9FWZ4_ARUDO